ncbi:MAG TPA: DUF4845 domain-containing protein [Rudaea sp.]|nr:DUF4845 domain-containing protein [Rudaea sp.]
MRMLKTQRGLTLIGFALMLCVVGFFAYGAMKLIPVYTEYFGVMKSVKSLQTEPGIENMNIGDIRRKLEPIFDVQYVDETNVPMSSVTLVTTGGQRSLRVAYDRDVPFLYNVDLLVHFENSVDISHGASY